MKLKIYIAALLAELLVLPLIGRCDVPQPAVRPHPRILADADDFARLRARMSDDVEFEGCARLVRSVADAVVPLPELKRDKVGKRLLGVSRRAVLRLLTLGMGWQLFGERKYAERGRSELQALCAFEDWNPSHFLDVGEMCVAVGMGYDWLYETLSDEDRKKIECALLTKGIEPYLKEKGTWRNNWGQVCHCGCLVGAAAVSDAYPEKSAECWKKLHAQLPLSMSAYAPAGNFPEGHGYWQYATEFAVIGCETLRRNFGGEELISDAPGFRASFDYPDYVTGPTGQVFNYADGGSGRYTNITAWYFVHAFGRSDLLSAYERRAWNWLVQHQAKFRPDGEGYRFFPLTLLWYQNEKDDTRSSSRSLLWNPGGSVPIAIQRSGWGSKDLFVGLKGGSPSAAHGHMDGGSFVLDAKGVRWALDLGSESYNAIEQRGITLWNSSQDSGRWSIYRLATDSHNTLMIDGAEQKVKGFARIVSATNEPRPTVEMDLTSLYPAAKLVLRRGAVMDNGYCLTDRLAGLHAGAKIRWAMTTRAKAEANGDVLTLSMGGQALTVRKTAAGSGSWEIVEDAPPHEWDSRNKGCRQVRFFTEPDDAGEAQIRVEFQI